MKSLVELPSSILAPGMKFCVCSESDLISFPKKKNHIAQMITLPADPYKRTPEERAAIAEYGLPTVLIVNMQLPVYQV